MEQIFKWLLFLVLTSFSQETEVEEVETEVDVAVVDPEPFDYHYENKYEQYTYVDVHSDDTILLVGDSRTVGFQMSVEDEDISYICKGSVGYNWLVNGTSSYNPDELIDEYLDCNPGGIVVVNLGINDTHNKQKYSEWVCDLVAEHPGSKICYMSINPVAYNTWLDNLSTDFNRYLKTNIPESVVWIDSNSYLRSVGFSGFDGVHYDAATYNNLHNYLLEETEKFDDPTLNRYLYHEDNRFVEYD